MRRSPLHSAWLATSLVLGSIDGAAGEAGSARVTTDGGAVQAGLGIPATRRLSPESTIGDLLDHPEFAGYSRLLMP